MFESELSEPEDAIELIRRGLAGLAGEDRRGWSAGARSARLVALAAVAERLDAETIRATGEWDVGCDWAVDGALSPRAWLAARTPLGGLGAARLVRAARFCRDHAASGEALAGGRVSAGQVRVLAPMARRRRAAYRDAEAVLLDCAETLDVDRFEKAARRWREIVDEHADRLGAPDAERQELRVSTVGQRGVVAGDLDPDTTQLLKDALDLAAPPDPAGAAEPPRSVAQRRADGLAEVCAGYLAAHHDGRAQSGRVPVGLGVVIDHDTLAGHGDLVARDPRTIRAELVGFGDISLATAHRLACDCAVARVVLRDGSEVLDLGRSERLPSAAQRRALAARDRHCVWPGCDRPPQWCQAHHLWWWEHGGPTDLDNMVLLCRRHHTLAHDGRWSITRDPDGTIDVTPPAARSTARPPNRRAPPRAA